MAAEAGSGHLTPRQIVRLAAAVSADNMESIAEGYMDIESETVKNLARENKGKAEAFNREVLRHWKNKNVGPNEVQTLASILYTAARECSYVDPQKVQEILGVTRVETAGSGSAPSTGEKGEEEEFGAMANELKPYTEEAMKLDMGPWAKGYTEVDMEKLFTKLKLEKILNEPTGQEGQVVDDYRELFEDSKIDSATSDDCASSSQDMASIDYKLTEGSIRKRKSKKVLMKGDPGMGKSSMCKKMAWDWAKGILKAFTLVFFVFLKLVQPGDAIENVIILQTPALKGMRITPQKLKSFLETFGHKCLIILDGLDEHALGQNQDVIEIIKGEKLLYCNILVTSRPHSTAEIERYFPTIVRLDGFTREKAEEFAFSILKDRSKVATVLRFNPYGDYGYGDLYSCPLLLLFLCILVQENEVGLDSETTNVGDIYYKICCVLYKKFTITKGISFERKEFISVLKGIGKLAWETLLSGNPFLQRSDVIRQVGEDAFQYGLLIGHEDFRFIGDVMADIVVTFPHRSIQEFLGALYFILMLREGETMEALLGPDCKEPICMTNPLFLRFCLWFINQKYVTIHDMAKCLEAMKYYISAQINVVQLDLKVIAEVHPVLHLRRSLTQEELRFFGDILGTLNKTKHLVLHPDDPVDFILTSMRPVIKNLSTIIVNNPLILHDIVNSVHHEGDLDIVLCGESVTHYFNLIPSHLSGRHPSLYLYPPDKVNLSELMHENLWKLYIKLDFITCEKEIKSCPFLTHLSIVNVYGEIYDSVYLALSKAVQDGKLPKLSHVSLEAPRLKGKLHLMFESPWPTVTHLSLRNCQFDKKDIEVLAPGHSGRLFPKLVSFVVGNLISDFYISDGSVASIFKDKWPNLKSLSLLDVSKKNIKELKTVFDQGNLPQLTQLDISLRWYSRMSLEDSNIPLLYSKLHKLDISHSSGITGTLSILLRHSFSSLNSLILSCCGLNSQDLCSLAQASVEGRLPELRHLDISLNDKCLGNLESFFDESCTWRELLSLNIKQSLCQTQEKRCRYSRDNEVLFSKVASGCLSSLQEVSLSLYSTEYLNAKRAMGWGSLRSLHMSVECNDTPDTPDTIVNSFLSAVSEMVETGYFPSLRVVQCTGRGGADTLYRLQKAGVCFYSHISKR